MDLPKESKKYITSNLYESVKQLLLRDTIQEEKQNILGSAQYFSVEQALIITEAYRKHLNEPRIMQRALSFKASCEQIEIIIEPHQRIVGNRTRGIRDGVVFPEAGIGWILSEIDTLPTRPQDPFQVREEDKERFLKEIVPFWQGKTLEDDINASLGKESGKIAKAVKINQKDHAQGHIIPDVESWLTHGPRGLIDHVAGVMEIPRKDPITEKRLAFHKAQIIALEGSITFITRYAELAEQQLKSVISTEETARLASIYRNCSALSERPPETYHEALQSLWFLFVLLQMESNASSFSPGRVDQYLLPYLERDLQSGALTLQEALELTESLFLCFNKIVYMRNRNGAKYFAGFPIGFNTTIGGTDSHGNDRTNLVSLLFLKAQEHLGMPQPNLTARLHANSPELFIDFCARVIGHGSGMPQIVNDESIIPALEHAGVRHEDASNYGLVGCVELSCQGNELGWSDAAMVNLVKILELTLNHGTCLITGETIGPDLGGLDTYNSFEELYEVFKSQITHYLREMVNLTAYVDRAHARLLPSPFLSSVIANCTEKGMDVTEGGAIYNLSGIQAIQLANVADSLAVLKSVVYEASNSVSPEQMLSYLRTNWEGSEIARQRAIHKVPKYGNDVEWVDRFAYEITQHFEDQLRPFTNARGGSYTVGLYTVSAHVPMGANVGASADGRLSGSPLADGGVSPMYGRDVEGPTAVLKSVSRLPFSRISNGSLLNMKFLPSLFSNKEDREKFCLFLKTFVQLGIHHIQFNVLNKKDLIQAQEFPNQNRHVTIRVAGYTAYFTELAEDLQNEIIERTSYDSIG